MTWVRLDEEFPDHPKVVTAGPLAGWLHVCALAYCNRHLTDGFVPRAQVQRLVNFDGVLLLDDADTGPCDVRDVPDVDAYALAETLVSLGMWEKRQGGYLIHDFLDYQPSRAEIEAQRKVKSEAGRAGGRRSGESRRSKPEAEPEAEPEADLKQPANQNRTRIEADAQPEPEAKWQAKTKPVPVPVPVPPSGEHSSSSKHQSVGRAPDDDEKSPIDQTLALIARRRYALAEAKEPIKNPGGYWHSVLRSVNLEVGDEVEKLLCEGHEPDAIVEMLCPTASSAPNPYAALQAGEWVEEADDEGRLIGARWVSTA